MTITVGPQRVSGYTADPLTGDVLIGSGAPHNLDSHTDFPENLTIEEITYLNGVTENIQTKLNNQTTDFYGDSENITSAIDVQLTSVNKKIINVNMTSADKAVILPDATTISEGGEIFILVNSGFFPVYIKDFSGAIVGDMPVSKTASIFLADNSTSSGNWTIGISNTRKSNVVKSIKLNLTATIPNAYFMQVESLDENTLFLLYRKLNGNLVARTAFIGTTIVLSTEVVISSFVKNFDSNTTYSFNFTKINKNYVVVSYCFNDTDLVISGVTIDDLAFTETTASVLTFNILQTITATTHWANTICGNEYYIKSIFTALISAANQQKTEIRKLGYGSASLSLLDSNITFSNQITHLKIKKYRDDFIFSRTTTGTGTISFIDSKSLSELSIITPFAMLCGLNFDICDLGFDKIGLIESTTQKLIMGTVNPDKTVTWNPEILADIPSSSYVKMATKNNFGIILKYTLGSNFSYVPVVFDYTGNTVSTGTGIDSGILSVSNFGNFINVSDHRFVSSISNDSGTSYLHEILAA